MPFDVLLASNQQTILWSPIRSYLRAFPDCLRKVRGSDLFLKLFLSLIFGAVPFFSLLPSLFPFSPSPPFLSQTLP